MDTAHRVASHDELKTADVARSRAARVESIDVMRGVVMILMALDHVRDFFGGTVSPTNIAATTVPLFFTRWVTHFCAPVFFLLTGTGAYLARRKRTAPDLAGFLVGRGLWLIVLELTVVRCLGYQLNFDYQVTMLIILWALGWSMITLGLLVRLPQTAVAAVGIALIVTHNLFDGVAPAAFGALAPVWNLLHVPGVVLQRPGHLLFAAYPLIPWIGVTAAGYGLGGVFDWEPQRRRSFLLRTGVALIAAFVVIRTINVYGDLIPWSRQPSALRTLLSFLNANKYPPSLDYLLMTLGPAMLFLSAIDGCTPRVLETPLVFGKVPMFYFLLHLPLIHLLALVVCFYRYGDVHWMFQSASLDQFPTARPPGWGYPLPVVYVIWAIVVVGLYPLCRWFAALKRRSASPWLSYL
jgi:uncharacterized membrane protein